MGTVGNATNLVSCIFTEELWCCLVSILLIFFLYFQTKMSELEEHRITTWRGAHPRDVMPHDTMTSLNLAVVADEFVCDSRPLVSIDPDSSLFEAIRLLVEHRVHRLPVIDIETGNVLYILTHKRILRFLYLYVRCPPLHPLPPTRGRKN